MEYRSIHISDVRQFKACRQRWHFSSPLRLNLAPRKAQTYFLFGRLVHDALEQYYNNRKPEAVLNFYERSMIEELKTLHRLMPSFVGSVEDQRLRAELEKGKYVVQHYMTWAADVDDFEMVHPERKFQEIELPGTDIVISGRFDGIIRRKNGALWLKEFKTAISLPSDFSFLLLDEQASLYLWAANQMFDEPVKGVLYTYLKKKAPAIPKPLKRGGLSKARSIDTTAQVYYNALMHYDLDPQDYIEILRHLATKPNNFFKRHQVRRSKQELDIFIERFIATAQEMLNTDIPIYPSPNMMECNRCSFFGACSVGASNPGMQDSILKTEYVPSSRRI